MEQARTSVLPRSATRDSVPHESAYSQTDDYKGLQNTGLVCLPAKESIRGKLKNCADWEKDIED